MRQQTTIGFDVRPAETHLTVEGSMWVEPNVDELRRAMQSAFAGDDDTKRRGRSRDAKSLIEEKYSWTRSRRGSGR